MSSEYMEFRDELATLAEADPDLDYTPVHIDEGFITIDEYACHYIHHETDNFSIVRLYFLEGEETIMAKCDQPSFVYRWNGKVWTCSEFRGFPDLSGEDLARQCVHRLMDLSRKNR